MLVQVDYDGDKSDAILPLTLLRLQNVTVASLTAENFAGWAPAGTALSSTTVTGTASNDILIAPPTRSVINAGDGNDEIVGSNLADEINGGLGSDIIDGGGGNDILRGGDGDDRISDSHGTDLIEGGAGNDIIDIYRPAAPMGGNTLAETVTVDAGDGNDYLRFEIGRHPYLNRDDRAITLIADLGAGDDVIELLAPELGVDLPDAVITLGAGRDRFILNSLSYYYGINITITDFTAGNAGDILDLAKAIQIGQGWDFVTNPLPRAICNWCRMVPIRWSFSTMMAVAAGAAVVFTSRSRRWLALRHRA
ncbi:MAG: calcium-binding protein [Sphingomonadaceae bacterium]